jgi:hypothetical protein
MSTANAYPGVTISHQREALRRVIDAFDLLAVARRRRPNRPGEIKERHAALVSAIAAARPLIAPPVFHVRQSSAPVTA